MAIRLAKNPRPQLAEMSWSKLFNFSDAEQPKREA